VVGRLLTVGDREGCIDGLTVGAVGPMVGLILGATLGLLEGTIVGEVGVREGIIVGAVGARVVGNMVGDWVGNTVGVVGAMVGKVVGTVREASQAAPVLVTKLLVPANSSLTSVALPQTTQGKVQKRSATGGWKEQASPCQTACLPWCFGHT
jgi:hypothetical protein